MKHYIVLLDRDNIPGELRMPDCEHTWVECPNTATGEATTYLWRASIGVTCKVPLSRAELDDCVKLQALIVTGERTDLVDLAACAERGIRVLHLPPDGRADQIRADALMDLIDAVALGR